MNENLKIDFDAGDQGLLTAFVKLDGVEYNKAALDEGYAWDSQDSVSFSYHIPFLISTDNKGEEQYEMFPEEFISSAGREFLESLIEDKLLREK